MSGAQFTIYSTYRAIEGLSHYALYAQKMPLILNEYEIVDTIVKVLNSKQIRDIMTSNLISRAQEIAASDLVEKPE